MSALSNARWVAVGQAMRVGVQVLGLIFLSRILSPGDFGLVAMATVVANFANLVRDLGTASAVIQRETLDEATKNTAYWFSLGIGSLLGLCIALLSPVLAAAFKAPALTGIFLLLSLTFPIASAASVHQALLERDSQFKLVARIESVSGMVGLAIAIALAHAGAGAYSLVAQTLAAAAMSTVQLWLASKWRPQKQWSGAALKSIWQFSSNLAAFNFVNYFSRNADSMIIGRFLGAGALGAYSLAYRLMLFPLQNLTIVASRALFPVMSRQQAAIGDMANLYLRTLLIIATVTAPMMAGLFALRDVFVPVVLGAQWSAAIDIIAWLAPVGFIQSLVSTVGTVFMARGRTDVLFKLGVFSAVLQIAAFLIGLRWGAVGVAACYFVANVINALPCLGMALRLVERRLLDVLVSIWWPVTAALLMAGLITLAKGEPQVQALPGMAQLILLSVGGACIYGALIALFACGSRKELLLLVLKRT
ncbi:MAG: flippase [Rhodocyclales bacterium]|nr:flippase [Rhodocyclales bacterium]